MSPPANDDRRKTPRQPCRQDGDAGGRRAVLEDWSFGGIGVRFEGGSDVAVGEEIDIRLFDPHGNCWEVLEGVVRWIDDGGKVGVEFKQTDQRLIGLLMQLMGGDLGGGAG
jgi:c-di-GMP-binding flagellar brake protein YcgR